MNEPKTFDVNAFLDEQKLGGTHFKIIALLILTMMVDGGQTILH